MFYKYLKNIRGISCLPLSWYHYSSLPPLKGHFKKYFFFIKWQKTLIPLFSIYIINNYLNKYKIYKNNNNIFLCFRITLFQVRTILNFFLNIFFSIFFFKISL